MEFRGVWCRTALRNIQVVYPGALRGVDVDPTNQASTKNACFQRVRVLRVIRRECRTSLSANRGAGMPWPMSVSATLTLAPGCSSWQLRPALAVLRLPSRTVAVEPTCGAQVPADYPPIWLGSAPGCSPVAAAPIGTLCAWKRQGWFRWPACAIVRAGRRMI